MEYGINLVIYQRDAQRPHVGVTTVEFFHLE